MAGSSSAVRDLGVLVITRLNRRVPWQPRGQTALKQHSQLVREVALQLYLALVWLCLQCCVHFWVPQYNRMLRYLKSSREEQRAQKRVKVLEGTSCEDTGLSCLEKRGLAAPCSSLRREGTEGSIGLCSLGPSTGHAGTAQSCQGRVRRALGKWLHWEGSQMLEQASCRGS